MWLIELFKTDLENSACTALGPSRDPWGGVGLMAATGVAPLETQIHF